MSILPAQSYESVLMEIPDIVAISLQDTTLYADNHRNYVTRDITYINPIYCHLQLYSPADII